MSPLTVINFGRVARRKAYELIGHEIDEERQIIIIQCLVCGNRNVARRRHNNEHTRCEWCKDTTNHCVVPS